jgi:transposase InsO family protein
MPGDNCSPYPPQTNGKLERFHETLKARLNLFVFASPEARRVAMAKSIEFYNAPAITAKPPLRLVDSAGN